MLIENTITLGLILLIAYFYGRKGRVAIGLAILPIAIVPTAQLIASALTGLTKYNMIYIIITMTALAVTMLLIGIFAKNIKKTYVRRTYMGVCGLYTLVATIIYLYKFLYS